MSSKEALQRSIDHLKKNIQYIIDRKKTLTRNGNNNEQVQALDDEKNKMMTELKKTSDDLKEYVRKEKEEKKRAAEIKAVSRAVDSLDFAGARKSKTQEAMDKAKRAKESREAAKVEYEQFVTHLEHYNKYDPQEVPGFLFLHEDVIKMYGLCPFIRLNITFDEGNDSSLTEEAKTSRSNWLRRQDDKGKFYFDLHDKIVHREEVLRWTKVLNEREAQVLAFLDRTLSDSQKDIWERSTSAAREYITCTIKTKRIKERYKMLIHNLSVLFAETKYVVHEFLSLQHGHQFVINDIKSNLQVNPENRSVQILLVEQFENLITSYKDAKEQLEQKTRYATNMLRNLQNELYLYLTNKKAFDGNFLGKPPKNAIQQGKYFKRWIALTEEEKLERFESYARWYVQRHMVQEKLLDADAGVGMTSKLYEVIKEAFHSKKLIYRDFKWTTKKGLIEKINYIKYNEETDDFSFTKKYGLPKEKPAKTDGKSKRKASARTIVTKGNERLINEELLCFIVSKLEANTEAELGTKEGNKNIGHKVDKEECIERIKVKLHLKKVTANDKVAIGQKYDEILNVVLSNQTS